MVWRTPTISTLLDAHVEVSVLWVADNAASQHTSTNGYTSLDFLQASGNPSLLTSSVFSSARESTFVEGQYIYLAGALDVLHLDFFFDNVTLALNMPTRNASNISAPTTYRLDPSSYVSFSYSYERAGGITNSTLVNLDGWMQVLDQEPPSFNNTCPTSIALDASATSATAVVLWTEPRAIDNRQVKRVVSANGYAPGQHFAIGVSLVTYYAFDYFGNSAICKFSVTVTDITVRGVRETVDCCFDYRYDNFSSFVTSNSLALYLVDLHLLL